MVTMGDIAQKAGVSRATVSFVLNGRDTAVRISEETRCRVLEAADMLSYRPNALAQSVARGRNPMLGFLVTKPEYEPVARMLSGAMDEAEERGYTLKTLRVRDGGPDATTIARCADLRLAGVVVMYLGEADLNVLHEKLARYAIPVAVLDSSFAHPWGIRVISDDVQGCRLVIEHLHALGHRRIAFLSGNPQDGVAVLREEGYCAAMRDCGLSVPQGYLQRGYWDPVEMERATRELLRHPDGAPTAIACASDETATVVARTLRREGRQVPRDVSVVGFSDLHLSAFGDPPLTTIAPPFHEMGRAVVQALLARADAAQSNGFDDSPLEFLLPTRLVVRDSTAPAPD